MTFEPIWSGIIACYLFLGGLGGGAQLGQRAVADEYVDVLQLCEGKG